MRPRNAIPLCSVLTGLLCLLSAVPASAKNRVRLEARETAQRIDGLLERELFATDEQDDETISVAPPVDDETFLRRVTLDLIGELPTAEEITAFVFDPDPDKRHAVVERLLADPRFGLNWGMYWRDVILARRNDERALIAAVSGTHYLADAFNQNKPWDEIARELITAKGNLAEDGRTILLAAQWNETADRAAEVSRIFLGIQIQCAQCHDHKTDRWKREQFHGLAAFFPRVRVRPVRLQGQPRGFEIVSFDRARNGARRRLLRTLEHRMPDPDDASKPGTPMKPKFFLTGQQLDFGVTDLERRQQLAEWITASDNPWFAVAFVNRIWAELVGEGFYNPIDDVGPDREPTAPQTCQLLASQFRAHGYDVKWLFRTITATDAYQRQSRSHAAADSTPFAACCTQRLRADQLFNALTAALDIDEQPPQRSGRPLPPQRALARTPRGQFAQIFGFDPSTPRDEIAGSIPQALALMNTSVIEKNLRATPRSMLGKLLASTDDNTQVTTELYLRVLAREPSDAELQTARRYVAEVGNRREAFEDLLWALINSTEFLHRE